MTVCGDSALTGTPAGQRKELLPKETMLRRSCRNHLINWMSTSYKLRKLVDIKHSYNLGIGSTETGIKLGVKNSVKSQLLLVCCEDVKCRDWYSYWTHLRSAWPLQPYGLYVTCIHAYVQLRLHTNKGVHVIVYSHWAAAAVFVFSGRSLCCSKQKLGT